MGVWMEANRGFSAIKTGLGRTVRGIRGSINRDLAAVENGQMKLTPKGEAVGLKIKDGALEEGISTTQTLHSLVLNDKGEKSLSKIAIAGGAGLMGVSAAGRIASGGGLYRDSDGNFDVIGIPIV